jgi:hypothetical protein
MTTRIVAGTVLVLATWALAAVAILGVGIAPAVLSGTKHRFDMVARTALWWGLGLVTAVVLLVSLVAPMRSPTSAVAILGSCSFMIVAGIAIARRTTTRSEPLVNWRAPSRSVWLVLGTLGAVTIYQAFKALGPVTNYDTGLYHLGAIKYAGDYSTIPGLANLYFPFGYNNSVFPLAAFLGNGPWDGVGFRLLNGLLMVLVMSDLAIRLVARRYTWGTFLLLLGIASCFIPLVAIADFWIVSPTADSAILLLTLISVAYLADFLSGRPERSRNGSVVAVTSMLMVSMRPTMMVFGTTAAVVILISLARNRNRPGNAITVRAWLLLAGLGAVLGAVQAVRDYKLSGWLLYPLSIVPFDVPWRAPDPVGPREATLAAARDPSAPDHYHVAHSWEWIPVWFGRLWSQWETYFLLLGVTAAIVALIVAWRSGARPHLLRIGLCLAPSLVAVLAWFTVSPPSFRFIWGPLFTIALIPLSAAIEGLHRRGKAAPVPWARTRDVILTGCALVLLAVTGYSAVARNQAADISQERSWRVGPASVPYAVAPVLLPPTQSITTDRGLVVLVPTPSDQCWDVYPLCAVNIERTLGLRGPGIQDGFLLQ